MDMSAPEPITAEADQPLNRSFATHVLDTLSRTLPAGANDDPEAQVDRWEAARALLVAMRPRDPVEAALAARAVAAHFAS
jgi:hypothetical protein